MKLLVFSDSHGDLDWMARTVEREAPQRVFHLGDMARDARRLQALFPQVPVEGVRGNCDGADETPLEREVLLEGRRLWLLHGHTYQVKLGSGLLAREARTRGVDGVFFGHTHRPVCDWDGRLWLVNPGSCRGWPKPTCAVVALEGGGMDCRILDGRGEGRGG